MRIFYILIPAMLFFTLLGCASTSYIITPEEALPLIEDDESVVLLDVRTPLEFNEAHIPGAELLPLADLRAQMESNYPDKSLTYIVYCRTGNRSADAIDILLELGYENIYDLGGIVDWPYAISR